MTEESLTAIKLVASFAQEDKEVEKFEKIALETKEIAKKSDKLSAYMFGFFKSFILGFYVYALWIGS